MAEAREIWITGIGIVSSLGEGLDANWRALNAPPPAADAASFAPYVVHRIVPLELDKQIPKKGDQRQMEPWQRIGTYAAGLALDSAGVKGKAEFLSKMDMIVAAGGGERDAKVDLDVAAGVDKATKAEAFVNERLMSDLRPTLFLAQLSNLLAGNISIVHGVVGSSRTFMGEEAAGVDAVRIAASRIAAGQSDIVLVGGAHNGERQDLLMLYEFGGHTLKDGHKPIWERGQGGHTGGLALGSLGAFLVLESRKHAQARGARPLAKITAVEAGRSNRKEGALRRSLTSLWETIKGKLKPGYAVLSGASGASPATADEHAFLKELGNGIAVRATGTYLGHGLEPQFPMNIALAAIALGRGTLFPPRDATGLEQPATTAPSQIVVTGVGHWRGEGLALIERAD